MDMFIPYMMGGWVNFEGVDEDFLTDRRGHSTFIKARLASGVSIDEAQAALAAMSAQNREAYPEAWRGRSFNLLPSSEVAIHPLVDGPLMGVAALLLTVVGLVLLIACTNLAGFLLARASQRRKEIAIRLAMGAKRWVLIRQLLTETVVLALLGGSAGLLVANWALQLLMAFQPPIPIPINLDVGLDRTVLLFTLAVSLAAGVFFGLVPALQSTNPDVAPTLKDETGSGAGRPKRLSLRNALVVGQVAISMVLLLGAGLFLRSLQAARNIDIGFSIREGGIAWVMAMGEDMDTEEFQTLVSRLEERAESQPGIDKVASAAVLPLGIAFQTRSFDIPEVDPPAGQDHHEIAYNAVSADFFDVWGIAIVAGRALSPEDRAGSEPVTVISETAARRFWPGEDPVGKVLIRPSDELAYRIVGVAGDTKAWTLGEEYRPYVYMAQGQQSDNITMLVATGTMPEARIAGELRSLVRDIDPRLVLMESKTVSEHLSIALFPPRMAALLLAVFGGLALILASTGLYGTVSFNVSRRAREMGIRMSLGADPRRVVRMVLGGALTLVAVGAGIGVGLSVGLAQLVSGFLYGIGTLDPVTFLGVPLFLAAVALIAALTPALRASRVNPVEALKTE
jgi:predicted permease